MSVLSGNYENGFIVSSKRVALKVAMKGKNTDSILWIYGTPANVQVAGGADGCELAQGVLKAEFYRPAGLPFTSAGTTGEPDGDWGGAYDVAARISVGNYALNTNARGGIQALRVYCRQYSGGSICNMLGAEISVDDRGSGQSVASMVGCLVTMRSSGVCVTLNNILVVECVGQGSLTPTSCSATAMLKIRSTLALATGARATGIHFETSGTGAGWTHAFSFETAAGKEGFTAVVNKALAGNVDGYIKVYDVATGQTLYINCYDAPPA